MTASHVPMSVRAKGMENTENYAEPRSSTCVVVNRIRSSMHRIRSYSDVVFDIGELRTADRETHLHLTRSTAMSRWKIRGCSPGEEKKHVKRRGMPERNRLE